MPPDNNAADAYIRFYETLSPATLPQLETVVTADIRFKDPFNDVRGIAAYRTVLAKMFDSVPDVRFKVLRHGPVNDVYVLRWTCDGTIKAMGKQPWHVDGMSELRFGADGKVSEHIDYWDAAQQFYERLPVIGGVLRFIRRRFLSHH